MDQIKKSEGVMMVLFPLGIFNSAVCVNGASRVSVSLLSSRLRRGQMKEASEMKYGDQVEGLCARLYTFLKRTILDYLNSRQRE